eukprot:CAMPEP_0194545120 /NCGR_PEP_ID=MMETSP0253-20130528/88650_1 /TAXON_ID=2966 /ORGANISM="Noctiluca scintillans" /LENGTH=105 /DNA_ID=CAMNT_0039392087 /DNA_START=14 /DNA_END=327 /DNA_ORIENTATION=+
MKQLAEIPVVAVSSDPIGGSWRELHPLPDSLLVEDDRHTELSSDAQADRGRITRIPNNNKVPTRPSSVGTEDWDFRILSAMHRGVNTLQPISVSQYLEFLHTLAS